MSRLNAALRALAGGVDGALDDADAGGWFWVDWRSDPEEIVEECARRLGDRTLVAEWVSDAMEIRHGARVERLVESSPHGTLRAVNALLSPGHEARFVWASDGSDTLAFVMLAASEWEELEREVGAERMERAFLRLAERPDVFKDRLRGLRPGPKPWWRLW